MWNVLTMPNGKNCLADLIGSDAGMIGDGRTNSPYIVYIQRYLARWSEYSDAKIDLRTFDFDSDGEAALDDAVRFARHLVKWIGYETLVR